MTDSYSLAGTKPGPGIHAAAGRGPNSPGAGLLPANEMIDYDRLRAAYEKVRDELLAERTPAGHWVGELSSSALATATAVSALSVVRRSAGRDPEHQALIDGGLRWLAARQNPDGAWGDTVKSLSNI